MLAKYLLQVGTWWVGAGDFDFQKSATSTEKFPQKRAHKIIFIWLTVMREIWQPNVRNNTDLISAWSLYMSQVGHLIYFPWTSVKSVTVCYY